MFYICSMNKSESPAEPPLKGRGAQSGVASTRFNLPEREVDGDWRDFVATLDGTPPKLRNSVTEEKPKSILTFNQSPDIAFDRSVNAYRGCEHGCVYCFARPTHAFHDLSPGLDFETQLFAKPDAARLLRTDARKTGAITCRARSPWAPTPIPTSRSRAATRSPASCSKCAWKRATR